MMIGDGLLTNIKEMIEVAERKGNTVVTSDDSDSNGVSERGNSNSDDDDDHDDDNDDGNNENEELSLAALIEPRTSSFVEPRQRRRKSLEFMIIEGKPQQEEEEKVAMEMIEGRRRSWIGQKRFSFILRNRNSDGNSNNSNDTAAKSLIEGSTAHALLRDPSVVYDDLVGDDGELGEFV